MTKICVKEHELNDKYFLKSESISMSSIMKIKNSIIRLSSN